MALSNYAQINYRRNPIQSSFWERSSSPSGNPRIGLRITHFDPESNEDLLRTDSMFLEEKMEEARTRYDLYKSRVQEAFNPRVKKREIQVGDLILRQSDALLDIGKLEPTWEGPYKVTRVLRGRSYELEDLAGKKLPCPWHVSHLKKYYV